MIAWVLTKLLFKNKCSLVAAYQTDGASMPQDITLYAHMQRAGTTQVHTSAEIISIVLQYMR